MAAHQLRDADANNNECNQGRGHGRNGSANRRPKRDTQRQCEQRRGGDDGCLLIEDVPAVDVRSLDVQKHNFQIANERSGRKEGNDNEDELHEEPAHSGDTLRPGQVLGTVLDFSSDKGSANKGAGQRREDDETVLSEVELENGPGNLPERVTGQAVAKPRVSPALADRQGELQRDITDRAAEQPRQDESPERLEPMLPPGYPGYDAASSISGLGWVPASGAER